MRCSYEDRKETPGRYHRPWHGKPNRQYRGGKLGRRESWPLRRWAEPDEIAEWVYFVGVTNRFMTGQNLLIDGGEAGRSEFIWPEE